jgi:hypothetical protein
MFGIIFIGLVLSLVLAYAANFVDNYMLVEFFTNTSTVLFVASCGYGIYKFYHLVFSV